MDREFDAVIVGSGFGGAMTARILVEAGWAVLLVERGGWVERGPKAVRPENFAILSPHYARDAGYVVRDGSGPLQPVGAVFCVGGPSVFYGGVSFRFREPDFHPSPEITGSSGAEWPIDYAHLEPFYSMAERIIGVAGVAGQDRTEPPHGVGYLAEPAALSPLSRRIEGAALRLGLHPFLLPMAIYEGGEARRSGCVRCGTCDGFACAIGAKNDLATRVIAPMLGAGLSLLPHTAVTRLVVRQGKIQGLECLDLTTLRRFVVRGRQVILAAGALATPHLLLASGLERANPAGRVVGRYLTRHINTAVFGLLPRSVARDRFVKQLGIHDYYGGDTGRDAPPGPLGGIQSLATPPLTVVRTQVPALVGWMAGMLLDRTAGLLTIAEDQPRRENGVALDPDRTDGAGLPGLAITHGYSARDIAADRALRRRTRRILRAAGAVAFYQHPIRTFSHALGTVRMGKDEQSAPLDGFGRFRGIENLTVADGSALPTSAAVNPSLTIAANALRIATHLAASESARAVGQEVTP
jgi:choline dehydrogenase-like flavoprotein